MTAPERAKRDGQWRPLWNLVRSEQRIPAHGTEAATCSCGLATEDQDRAALNEPAFRHFLAIERARADHAQGTCLIVLVLPRAGDRGHDGITPVLAGRLFPAIRSCVREVDFVGWLRQGRAIAAVLPQSTDTPAREIGKEIGRRIARRLAERLPARAADRLRVRVLQPGRRATCEA